MESKLYVGNLSYSTTEDDLRTLFTQAGTVASVALIKDRDSGQSKGFAFVEMSTQVEAEKAISTFNGFHLGDRELKVSLARPRGTHRLRQSRRQQPRRSSSATRRRQTLLISPSAISDFTWSVYARIFVYTLYSYKVLRWLIEFFPTILMSY